MILHHIFKDLITECMSRLGPRNLLTNELKLTARPTALQSVFKQNSEIDLRS